MSGLNSKDGGPLGDAEWLKRLVANRCSDEEFGEAMKGRSFGGVVTYRLQEEPNGSQSCIASYDTMPDAPDGAQPGDERLQHQSEWADNAVGFGKRLLQWARRHNSASDTGTAD